MPRKKIPVPVPPASKWCHQCQQVRPIQMFGQDRSKKDGMHYCCLRCADDKDRQRAARGAEFSRLACRSVFHA
ncbi:hypothetical protein BV98_001556 [Sphingobium herbicidovorans NBRC 16415]|uniref:Uncharacterized protein n=1 Tax=Sphingobium herbicidovorans (strain ATCC 700291 / DSM 11019 / CCUG 56400 / KCTC 2939 / LMG 18315 / NBRC 16415 / MH) TaxID=1219045 RepID=A0A086PAD5_SPHHM|nr:hypothetical protein BV98_001556 [Sphingobium herbicidovorans NBRC 16415]